jgi:hypothetical protein
VVTGDLTIKDVTRSVQFAVEGPSPETKDPWGNTRIGVAATTKINRKDFGLTWNAPLEAGGLMVGEDISITLDLEFCEAGIRATLGGWKDDPPPEHNMKACLGGAREGTHRLGVVSDA